MNIIKDIIEFLLLEKNNINHVISNFNNELINISNDIGDLSFVYKELNNDIENISIDSLKVIASKIGNNLITEDDLKKIEQIKKVAKFIYNPEIPYIGVKKEMLDYINKFSKKIDSIIVNYNDRIIQINDELDNYKKRNIVIENYLNILNDNDRLLDLSFDELNTLFDFLRLLSIDNNKLFEIISYVTINKLKREEILEKQRSIELLSNIEEISKKIEENSEQIIGIKKEVEEIKKIDLSNLSDDEKKLLDELELIFKNKNIKPNSGLNLLIENSFDKDIFNIDERMDLYLNGDKLDWDAIYADYYTNLLPNIDKYKDEILAILKKVFEQYNIEKRESTLELEQLSLEVKKFRDINAKNKILLKEYYDSSNELSTKLSSDDFQILSDIVSEITRISEDTMFIIENNGINSVELNRVNLQLERLIEKFKDITRSVVENEEISNNVYNLNTTKTLILLLKNYDNNFVPNVEIKNETDINSNSIMTNELEKAITQISGKGMSDNKKTFRSSHIEKTTGSGKDITLKKHFGFDVDRIRFTGSGRTGYIIVPVCENNKQKLINVYGENIFYRNYNSIIMIVRSICVFADHFEYEIFKDLITDNLAYVNYVLKLFSNPNADVNELCSIIEESADECKKISSGYKRGGK